MRAEEMAARCHLLDSLDRKGSSSMAIGLSCLAQARIISASTTVFSKEVVSPPSSHRAYDGPCAHGEHAGHQNMPLSYRLRIDGIDALTFDAIGSGAGLSDRRPGSP
jgi:hypothetical protein